MNGYKTNGRVYKQLESTRIVTVSAELLKCGAICCLLEIVAKLVMYESSSYQLTSLYKKVRTTILLRHISDTSIRTLYAISR